MPKTKVKMLMSVGAGDLEINEDHAAGATVSLDAKKADEYIIKGYAEGELSRDYDEDEKAGILRGNQVIVFGEGGK